MASRVGLSPRAIRASVHSESKSCDASDSPTAIRIVIPRRFAKAKSLHVWALRDDLTKQLERGTAREFETYLETKHNSQASTSNTPPPVLAEGAKRFASARFQALERVWQQGGPAAFSTLYMPTIKEQLQLV